VKGADVVDRNGEAVVLARDRRFDSLTTGTELYGCLRKRRKASRRGSASTPRSRTSCSGSTAAGSRRPTSATSRTSASRSRRTPDGTATINWTNAGEPRTAPLD
jgi:hypothetical protein